MTRPKMLDTYSCAGGGGVGYDLAGFEVFGLDKEPQPHYPFEFRQGDALEALGNIARGEPAWPGAPEFDAIHASPTCQTFARVTAWRGSRDNHPDLLRPTLALLEKISLPWIVENVPEACPPLRPDYLLCGTQFDLKVRRHRAFMRGNWSAYELMPGCQCYLNPDLIAFEHKGERAFADAMGCTWMSAKEARQAIPPAMTHHIGRQLIGFMEEREAA